MDELFTLVVRVGRVLRSPDRHDPGDVADAEATYDGMCPLARAAVDMLVEDVDIPSVPSRTGSTASGTVDDAR